MVLTSELKIYGKIHHVGFRDKIEHMGIGLGIDGIVYNYNDGTVRILANFEDAEDKEIFKQYIKRLEKKDKLITIERIEDNELNSYIEFPSGINRISADDLVELNKKLDEGVEYIKMIFGTFEKHLKILNLNTDLLNSMNDKLDTMNNKLDTMNDKLDTMNNKLDTMNNGIITLNSKFDVMIELQKETIEILKNK